MSDWNNPNHLLDGATAVVTGSTRGIGAAIAEQLASVGASVVVSGRTVEAGEEVVKEITESGGNAAFTRVDVREPKDIQNLIDAAKQEFGGSIS